MRIKSTISLFISDDSAGRQALFGGADRNDEIVISNMQRMTSGKMHIAALAAEDVSFGDVDSARGVYFDVDGECVVTLNGGAEQFTLTPSGTGSRARFFFEGTLSAVNIENTGSAAITGTYVVWGDPTV